ncbi:MAG TPA: Imm5 family immunity protein, partial [Stellaceae bacterium]|nr:Imm5 family immunity protein [Stellaceae bacterium]
VLFIALRDAYLDEDSSLDSDYDYDEAELEAGFMACCAFSGAPPWNEGSDRARRLEFWEWYLNCAVPRAYAAIPFRVAAHDAMPMTKSLLDRLTAIDRVHPVLEKPRVERALAEHFRRLKFPELPVRWMGHLEAAYRHLWQAAYEAEPRLGEAATEIPLDALTPLGTHEGRAAALGRALDRAVDTALEGLRHRDDDIHQDFTHRIVASDGWQVDVMVLNFLVGAAVVAVRDARPPGGRRDVRNRRNLWQVLTQGMEKALAPALQAAQWVEIAHRSGAAEAERYARILLPLLEASEAGLWCFWATTREIVAVPRPAIRTGLETLHSCDGPVIAWP